MRLNSFVFVAFGIVLAGSQLFAHQPTISDGTAVSADTAIEFEDIQISRVVYHEVTSEASQIWLTFEVSEPQSLYLSLGMPEIDRLANLRPAYALLGPGLPDVQLPFDIPDGLGGLLFTTENVTSPEVFDEPFSCTSSFILDERNVDLPLAGRYYVVAFIPNGSPGKLWVATGDQEVFLLRDVPELLRISRDVRSFHEVPRSRFLACCQQRMHRRSR